MPTNRFSAAALILAAIACAAPAAAQRGWGGGWGHSGWGSSTYGGYGGFGASRLDRRSDIRSSEDSREGRVDAAHFVADDAGDALGHGPIAVTAAPESSANKNDQAYYEAAIVDQLVKAGYDTTKPDPEGGQIAELRIVRDVLVPQETKRKPVSGEVTVGASNYGTFTGMAIAVDLSKPKKALISTRLEARVRDRATGKALWEGRAEMATREGDSRWSEQAIASKLAAAMFEHFPEQSDDKVVSR